MKKTLTLLFAVLAIFATLNVSAQEEEKTSPWSASLDIYSSYIWRGAKFGEGVAFQPSVEFAAGNLTLGVWGNVCTSYIEGREADIYATYTAGALTLGVTDYYFGGDWTDFSTGHSIEPIATLAIDKLSLTAAYMFLAGTADDPDTSGDESTKFGKDGDFYAEAAYDFGKFKFTAGMGDGQYTDNGKFNVCNLTLSTGKEIKVTDSWTIPVTGAATLNPSTGGFFVTVGLSL